MNKFDLLCIVILLGLISILGFNYTPTRNTNMTGNINYDPSWDDYLQGLMTNNPEALKSITTYTGGDIQPELGAYGSDIKMQFEDNNNNLNLGYPTPKGIAIGAGAGAVTGATTGLGVGMFGGPHGAVAGTAIGAGLGAIGGGVTGALMPKDLSDLSEDNFKQLLYYKWAQYHPNVKFTKGIRDNLDNMAVAFQKRTRSGWNPAGWFGKDDVNDNFTLGPRYIELNDKLKDEKFINWYEHNQNRSNINYDPNRSIIEQLASMYDDSIGDIAGANDQNLYVNKQISNMLSDYNAYLRKNPEVSGNQTGNQTLSPEEKRQQLIERTSFLTAGSGW